MGREGNQASRPLDPTEPLTSHRWLIADGRADCAGERDEPGAPHRGAAAAAAQRAGEHAEAAH